MKDLKIVKECTRNQEARYNFRLGFALSNRPHLHRASLVTVPFILILAVHVYTFYFDRSCREDGYDRGMLREGFN